MVEANDFRLAIAEIFEHLVDFFGRHDRFDFVGRAVVDKGPVGVHVTELFFPMSLDELFDAGAPGDHREIGRQRAQPFELFQHGIVVGDDFQQDLSRDVFDVFGSQKAASRVGDVLNHVVDQAHVAVNEVVPCAGLFRQAAIDELAVNVAQGHGGASSRRRMLRSIQWDRLERWESA